MSTPVWLNVRRFVWIAEARFQSERPFSTFLCTLFDAGEDGNIGDRMERIFQLLFCMIALFSLAIPQANSVLAAAATPGSSALTPIQDYKLGAGDKVRVTVFGEDDLGGEFAVDGSGYIRLPLIGQVRALGLSAQNLEADITSLLKDGYLKAPRVNVEVTSYRPFYIMGEVSRPGQYPYVNGMTVLHAIALAGGYTERARTTDIDIRRNGQSQPERLPVDPTVKVFPDDIITVRQRFF
jgi:polysaccharide export outer membrane protein